MNTNVLEKDITYLKLVGPERAKALREAFNINTFGDLLYHIPIRYEDRSKVNPKATEIVESKNYQFSGILRNVSTLGQQRKKRIEAELETENFTLKLLWFKGIQYLGKQLISGKKFVVYGKLNRSGSKWSIVHPEIKEYKSTADLQSGFSPVYPSSQKAIKKGINSKSFGKILEANKELFSLIPPIFPEYLLNFFKIKATADIYKNIHFPKDEKQANIALAWLKFEELFTLQLLQNQRKAVRKKNSQGFVFQSVGKYFNDFYQNHIPFDLTNAQKRVIKEIRKDCADGYHMSRLLQGDVGSGKTMVAFLCSLIAIDSGFQVALMAPTEILAKQHAQSLAEWGDKIGLNIQLLTGSTKTAARRAIHSDLETGNCQILVGTHALIEDKVKFKNLGLVIVDEQHRFGVAQRAKLLDKNSPSPHLLVMTATPIPRTLAMSHYGDLDFSVIDELPPGRKEIQTFHKTDAHRSQVFGFMEEEIKKGRQIYVVYPLIEESESLDYKDLMDGYESITRRFPSPKYQVSIVHGKMDAPTKDYEMQRFAKGETQIMVATTVIEVGVNVPNASVMVIESAEKFGLSQLHQLRGRIGRGSEQSYCLLMSSKKLSSDAKERLSTMVNFSDGFKIAEVDLKLRGPGNVLGTQQSGSMQYKVANIAEDFEILKKANAWAQKILEEDPLLVQSKNRLLKQRVDKLLESSNKWSQIG